MSYLRSFVLAALFIAVTVGCGGRKKEPTIPAVVKEAPPEPGPSKDVSLPKPARSTLENGLEVNASAIDKLPLVYARLIIRSGRETDPGDLPGLSALVATMLKEGTTKRSSAELAEQIEFLGADLWTHATEEELEVGVRAVSQHFDEALAILGEVALSPAFRTEELDKLKRRELDRLSRAEREPRYLARRAFYQNLYGSHPYARVDTTPQAVAKLRRKHLVAWHRKHFVANNAFLVIAGDITPERVQQGVQKVFGAWRGGKIAEPYYAAPPARSSRSIVVVDRPGSVQSVIYLGNLAIKRADPDWIPLMVANQVLGGSAASRLFMDLREKRSLTYGAYSAVTERAQPGAFIAYASVRTEVTTEAVGAFFEHLDRIVTEPPGELELMNAKRFLSDSFPLRIDTVGEVASRQAHLRTFGLPDDYWDHFRSEIRAVTGDEALDMARKHIRPSQELVVVVGQAADFAESLKRFGPVRVIAPDGEVKARFE